MVYIFRELQEVYDQNLCLIPEFMVTFGKYVLTLIFFFQVCKYILFCNSRCWTSLSSVPGSIQSRIHRSPLTTLRNYNERESTEQLGKMLSVAM